MSVERERKLGGQSSVVGGGNHQSTPGKRSLVEQAQADMVQGKPAPVAAQPATAAPRNMLATPGENTAGAAENTAGDGAAAPTEKVAGSLWAQDQHGHNLPPSLDDIAQGGVNDCFLFASMAAVVHSDSNKIVKMIQDNDNGTYTVTFKGIGWFSSATQTVSADFLVGKHGNVTARKALWPLIIEKAYAQEKGGIDGIDKGGNPGGAVDDFTNTSASRFNPQDKSAEVILGKLAAAMTDKIPTTLLAPKKDDASKEKKQMADSVPGIHFWHAYTVLEVDEKGRRVKLFNPWGNDHPNGDGWITIEQLKLFFIEVNIN